MPETLYVVGCWLEKAPRWMIIGVFTTEAAAVAACRTPRHFVGPIPVDTDLGDTCEPWPDSYRPVEDKEA